MIGHALPLFASFRGGKSVMCFVGGAFALSPLAALCALGLAVVVSLASAFKYGARAGVFGFPVAQLAFDPVHRVWATGVLMGIIGVLFGLDALKRRRSAHATPRRAQRRDREPDGGGGIRQRREPERRAAARVAARQRAEQGGAHRQEGEVEPRRPRRRPRAARAAPARARPPRGRRPASAAEVTSA